LFTSSEKATHVTPVQRKAAGDATFFRKAGDESFFGAKESPAFFSPTIQPKLSVSSPDDPQEKEADAMAEQVMRAPEPAAAPEKKEEEKLQKKEEQEEVQTKLLTSVGPQIQCKENLQQTLQPKRIDSIQRTTEEGSDAVMADTSMITAGDTVVNRKNISFHHSDVIQRSGRGPPASSIPFEQSLSSSRGSGNALPGDTRQYMESRFGADFSGVRVHTGTAAESLSSNIHAQAFTHGNDIYFNSGKYAPQTEAGGLLLAHELTHTIQQGASKTTTSPQSTATPAASAVSTKPISVSRKKMIQRSADGVPAQLTNAVAKAKTMENKINAKLPGPDGYRTGWQHLLDIFKTTFGEDKIISGAGGTSVPGTVSEMDIKKYRETTGLTVIDGDPERTNPNGVRDAMPSWCGIFVFWALNKSGVPMPKWELGRNVIKPEAINPPGYIPKPGDIAWRRAYSHFAIVESVSGDTVKTVNGNTAGADNMGGQVQTVEHKLDNWSAFFSPLMTTTGPLTSGEAPASKPKTFAELRKELFKVNRKEEGEQEEKKEGNDVQAKQETSSWSVDAGGSLQTGDTHSSNIKEAKVQSKEEEKKEEEEQQAVTTQPSVQKKHTVDVQCKCSCGGEEESKVQAKTDIQREQATDTSSLNSYADAAISEKTGEMDRGPPAHEEEEIVQRDVIDDALSFIGSLTDCITIDLDKAKGCALQKAQQVAMHIPGYKALRVVLSKDPITGDHVDRSGRNFIEAAFDIMPGGALLHKKLDEQHQLDAAAAWIDQKIGAVESLVNGLVTEIETFWNKLGKTDMLSPKDVLKRGARIVLGFIDKVVTFAKDAAIELLEMVKKFLLDKIVGFIKENTTAYPLLCVILGEDPITKQKVDKNGTNILNAMLELGGEEGRMQRDQMKDTGTFQKVAAYIDEGIVVFGDLLDKIINAFKNIWDYVKIENLMDPKGTFEKIYKEFAGPVKRVMDFVEKVVKEILKLVKDVLFKRISAEAKKTRGYFLVTVLINKDPFTGEVVPRTMENIIHGFMSLMDGGEEQFQQMKESGAIDQTTAKIEAAVKRLNMTPQAVLQLFIDLWNSFTFKDFLHPIETFKRIIDKFGEPIVRLIAFVVEIVKIVVEVILTIMNFPFDLINKIIANAMKAFHLIKQDPIGFLKNLLRAIKEGFMQFFDNIITHLIQGLVGWLTSELKEAGVPELKDLSLKGIISWVLEVLGISMDKIWERMAKHPKIGPAKVAKIKSIINTVTGIWTFIKDVQERGVAAIWDKIQEQLSNLWDTILNAVKDWIMDKIINAVVTKLLSMLDPTGIMAVINSAIALYKAIQSFIKYIREMLEIVNSFVEGVVEIASGNTKKAADFLERSLARAVPIVIGFLANQVGLGGIGQKIGEMIGKAREMVEKAIDWLIDKAVQVGGKLLEMGKAAIKAILKWLGLEKKFTAKDGTEHRLYFTGGEENPTLMIASNPTAFSTFIESVDVGTDEKKKTAKEKAKPIAVKIDAKKKEPLQGATDEQKEESKKAKLAEVETLLGQLAEPCAELFGDAGAAGEPEVNFTTQGAGHAATMTAKRLNNKQKLKGSPPTGSNTGSFAVLNTRRQSGSASYYVKGHMLNDNIGGKGIWDNLTPLSREGNSNHEGSVESLVKAAFSSGAVVEYNVTAMYGYGNNAASIPADDPQKDQKLKIIAEEKNVPTALQCEAYIMEKKGDAFERKQSIVAKTVNNPVEQDAASYILEGTPGRADVFLNTSDVSVIATIEGFSASLASKIEKAHAESGKTRFNSYGDLMSAKSSDKAAIFTADDQAKISTASALKYVKLYKA
jgi:hypothetical protein